MSVVVETKGLKAFTDYFERLPEIAGNAASMAINDVAGGTGLTMLRKEIYDEIDFPAGYLSKDRLFLKSRATPSKLTAKIVGRDRPTSLARFATRGQTVRNTRGKGVKVQVKAGRIRGMKKAWLTPLRAGRSELGNVGLAVRVGPGQTLRNSHGAKLLRTDKWGSTYLFYGPSVNQVFGDVAWDNRDKLTDMLVSEFLRQVGRLSRG
jgi:hypothetical protein